MSPGEHRDRRHESGRRKLQAQPRGEIVRRHRARTPQQHRRGEVRPKPDLAELRGRQAAFKDGTAEPIDLVVFATGYRVTFPFLEARDLNSADGRPNFYLHTFHPAYDDLFILGNLQPDSGVWPLMELQARAIAGYVRGAGADAPAVAVE